MRVAAAAVMVRPFAGDVLDPFQATGGVEHQLGHAAVQILPAQPQKVGVLIKIDGQLPAVDFPGALILDLHD